MNINCVQERGLLGPPFTSSLEEFVSRQKKKEEAEGGEAETAETLTVQRDLTAEGRRVQDSYCSTCI